MGSNVDHSIQDNLIAIGRQLHRAQSIPRLLQQIADAAAELTQSEGSAILLFDEDTQQLYFATAHGHQSTRLKPLRVPLENSVAGWVYMQNKALLIDNAQIDPLVYRVIEKSTGVNTRSLAAVPIFYQGEVLGVLEAINKAEAQPYSPPDQLVLETLAGYAATAIKASNLTQQAQAINRERDELDQQKSDFIAIAAHELRTPLGLVLGHATFLRELTSNETHAKQLDVIIRNAERLKEIIDSLNRVENFQVGTARIRWQKADFRKLLLEVIESLKAEAAEYEIGLEIDIPSQVIPVLCDAHKLHVAVSNVLKNAIIFSNNGQVVNICLEKLPGHVRVSITDQGIGIPTEDLHRIFERFYQVEPHLTRRHGGMGLGLAVTKAVVESHGGQIWVESTLGQGSTFTILLPTEGTSSLGQP